jgi:hypothetical protein
VTAEKQIVWFIEDSIESAEEYSELLGQSDAFEFVHIPPRPSTDDYADIVANPRTGVIIIDQKLSPFSGVPYTGLNLADYLRILRPNLPIFILTSVIKDFESFESEGSSVEAIIKKGAVRDSSEVYIARFSRSARRYDESLTEKQQQMMRLLDKLDNGLSKEEGQELEELQDYFERPFRPAIESHIHEREEEIQERRSVVNDLQQLVEKIERLDSKTD